MKKSSILSQIAKPNKVLLIIGIVIAIIGLFGGGLLSFLISNEDATNLRKVDEEGIYSEIDVALVTSYFATLETNSSLEKYYFITDSEGYTYIAKIDDETFSELKANYDYNYSTDPTLEAPDAVLIYGMSSEIPEDIKNFAIEYLQENLGLNDVNNENFNNVIYPFLINTYVSKTDTIIDIAIIFGIITVIGLLIIMFYMNYQTKNNKTMFKYKSILDSIEEELQSPDVISSPLCKTYITTNYVVSYNKNINIVNISNIIWIYPIAYQQGFITSWSICLVTNDKFSTYIGKLNITNKNKEITFNELYEILLRKTPNALHGYSKENKEKIEGK